MKTANSQNSGRDSLSRRALRAVALSAMLSSAIAIKDTIMKNTMLFFVFLAAIGSGTAAQSAVMQSFQFSQSGFSSGGTVSGTFRGTDLDGDGQIYSMSRGVSDMLGVPFGNELDYARVTFDGFDGMFDQPLTLVYDKSVADMEDISNFFMAFAYNLDGGSFGDDADEGWSYAFFSPSINYYLGEAFSYFWDDPLQGPTFGSCGSGEVCGGVVEWIPENNEFGIIPGYTDFSTIVLDVTPVPVPAALWFMMSGIGVLAAGARRKRVLARAAAA